MHSNNVNSAFNGFRACGELGIKNICYASSVNAIGLAYANQPLKFKYFPIDEEYPVNPTDSYALAKHEAEVQARAFVNWFPGMKIALMRIHEVAPKKDVEYEHKENWQESAVGTSQTSLSHYRIKGQSRITLPYANQYVGQLWGWVHPQATARACLAALEKADNYEGAQIFNVIAPNTTQKIPSSELAKKYYPDAEIREGLEGTKAFWTTDKAKKILGWEHTEKQ